MKDKNSIKGIPANSVQGDVSGSNYQIYFSAYRKSKSGTWKFYTYPPIIDGITKSDAIELCNKLSKDLNRAGYVGNGYYCYKRS